jgi:hypothetical protein
MTGNDEEISDVLCAPGVKFLGGSCITIPLLEDMIRIYNSENSSDKIDVKNIINMKETNPITYKKNLVNILTEKMKNYSCKSQTCWLSLPFFKKLSDLNKTKQLHKYTFKPIGPKNSHEWLNTFNINDIFRQYEIVYPDFKFMGAHPRDFDKLPSTGIPSIDFEKLLKQGIYRIGFIFNLDTHDESGSHWVSLFTDLMKKQIYYIDSVGEPPLKEFVDLMDRIKNFLEENEAVEYCSYMKTKVDECNKPVKHEIDIRYNKKQHQRGNSECGVYAVSFILRLLDGESFDEMTKKRVSDEEIQLCRLSYFRKK